MFSKVVIISVLISVCITKICSQESTEHPSTTEEPDYFKDVQYRLPNDTHPIAYNIFLETRVDLNDFNFSGQVEIEIFVDKPTNELVLHKRRQIISEISLTKIVGNATKTIEIKPFVYNEISEMLVITSNEEVFTAGDRLILKIIYNGILAGGYSGFYRSSYVDTDGNVMYAISSKKFSQNDFTKFKI